MAARGRLAVRAGHGRALLRLYGRSHIRFIPAHALVDTHRQQRSCGGAVRWGEPQHATCRTHGSAATKEFEPNRWLHRNQAAASALLVDEAISRRRGQRGSRKLETAGRHTCFSGCDVTGPSRRPWRSMVAGGSADERAEQRQWRLGMCKGSGSKQFNGTRMEAAGAEPR